MEKKHTPFEYPQTPETAATKFRDDGICISHWCRDLGLPRMNVVDLIRKRNKGYRGNSHLAAVALGLKKGKFFVEKRDKK
jgi:gp16 family phage-associated protein